MKANAPDVGGGFSAVVTGGAGTASSASVSSTAPCTRSTTHDGRVRSDRTTADSSGNRRGSGSDRRRPSTAAGAAGITARTDGTTAATAAARSSPM